MLLQCFVTFPFYIILWTFLVGNLSTRAQNCGPAEYQTNEGLCCPMCSQGTVVRRDCTVEYSTSCIPCLKGTYMNEANGLTKCILCSSCGSGLVVEKECTTQRNTVCDVLDGYYCQEYSSDSGCSLAVEHTRCARGQRTERFGTKKTDAVCEDCRQGYYSQFGMNCTAWTSCAGGQVVHKEGTPTTDVVCGNAASRHHYTLLTTPILLILLAYFCYQVTKGRERRDLQGGGSRNLIFLSHKTCFLYQSCCVV